MQASGTFEVTEFTPSDYTSPVTTATSVGHAHMVKEYAGSITGRSTTQFSFAFDQTAGIGTYVALEAFEGTVDGLTGSFAYAHSATTDGISPDRLHELMVIAPGSGSGQLAGIIGTGAMEIDTEGVHRVHLDYELTPQE